MPGTDQAGLLASLIGLLVLAFTNCVAKTEQVTDVLIKFSGFRGLGV